LESLPIAHAQPNEADWILPLGVPPAVFAIVVVQGAVEILLVHDAAVVVTPRGHLADDLEFQIESLEVVAEQSEAIADRPVEGLQALTAEQDAFGILLELCHERRIESLH